MWLGLVAVHAIQRTVLLTRLCDVGTAKRSYQVHRERGVEISFVFVAWPLYPSGWLLRLGRAAVGLSAWKDSQNIH